MYILAATTVTDTNDSSKQYAVFAGTDAISNVVVIDAFCITNGAISNKIIGTMAYRRYSLAVTMIKDIATNK